MFATRIFKIENPRQAAFSAICRGFLYPVSAAMYRTSTVCPVAVLSFLVNLAVRMGHTLFSIFADFSFVSVSSERRIGGKGPSKHADAIVRCCRKLKINSFRVYFS